MKNYFGQDDFVFSFTLTFFLTWTNALCLNAFGFHEILLLLWAAILNFLISNVVLWTATRIFKRPIFSPSTIRYYPLRPLILISLGLTTLFGILNYIYGDKTLTVQRIITYIIGLILGTGTTSWTFYRIIKKK